MPLIDMPLEKLREYQGRNPRPADFDAYWDRAIVEMHALGVEHELEPAIFQTDRVKCSHLFFRGVGGARVHAKLLQPKERLVGGAARGPAVVVFHGYTGASPQFADLLNYAASGYTVAALDVRGQGGRSEDVGGVTGNTHHGHIIRGLEAGAEKLLFRSVFLDCGQLARIVMSLPGVDAGRVGAMGNSQGGALCLACGAVEPGVKRIASCFPFLCDYQRVWEMDQAKDAYVELRNFFRNFDPNHEREAMYFERLGYIDIQHLASRIRGRVVMACGLMDTICPPSTQFAAFNKMTCPKEVVIWPDFGHEGLPGWSDRVFEFFAGL